MLQLIRSRVTSIFVKALFVLLIASFAVWGIGDIFLGSPTGKAAIEVGEVEVTTAEVLDEFQRVRQSMGLQLTAQEAADIGLLDQVMQDLANRALFVAESNDLGLAVGDDLVRQRIGEMAAFRDQTGQFNPDLFRQVLFRAQLSEDAFLRILRDEMTRDQIVNAVSSGLSAPKVQSEALYRFRNEQREAKLVALDVSTLPEPAAPSDSEIDAFYNENKESYRAPEYRSATAIALTADAIAKDIEVSDEALREAYETRLDEFRTEARRTVDQMFLVDKEAADKAAAALGEGKSFETVAEEVAGMSADALSLGNLARGDLDGTSLADAVFGAALNEPTAPVESDLGWHIFRVTEITDETTEPFEAVKERLRHDIAQNDALDRIFELANQIEDALAAGDTIEEAARAVEVDVTTFTDIDNQGQHPDGSAGEGMATDGAFRRTLFATPLDEQSQLEETANGGYFILRTDAIREATIRPLDEVREQVTADLIAERRAEANLKRANELVAKAAGGSLEAAATELGYEVQTLAPFSRRGEGLPEGIPGDVAEIAFDLKIGDIGMSEDLTRIHVTELSAIDVPSAEQAGDDLASLGRQVRSGMTADAMELLIAGLREGHGVTLNAALPLGVIQGIERGDYGTTGSTSQGGGLF